MSGSAMTRRFLWAVPRSLSTAFERWVIERGDHHVIDEPFSAVYYLGPERVSPRYDEREPGATAAATLADVLAAPLPCFVKDMVHHVPVELRADLAAAGSHTLLVRDPARAIPSFARVWPDVTWEECGYEALAGFAEQLDADRRPYDVVDAEDLGRDPEATLRSWSQRQALGFDPATLAWESGPVPQWTRWSEFHTSTIASTGLSSRGPAPLPTIDDPRIAGFVERATPLYERLRR